MSREVPSLLELMKKFIAKVPSKCLTEEACERFLTAIAKPRSFQNHPDIIQEVLNTVIEAGRMTDEAASVVLFRNRSLVFLSNSKISGKYLLKAIPHCSSTLTKLDVSGCFQIMDITLSTIFATCPQLTYLNVRNCRKLTNQTLTALCNQKSPHSIALKELNIGGNMNINDDGLLFFFTSYSFLCSLEDFTISGLSIRDSTILYFIQKISQSKGTMNLKSLGIAYMDWAELTYQQLLTTFGKTLEHLDISWSSTTPHARNLQPSAVFLIEMLVMNCPSLRSLDLTSHRHLTLVQIQEIIEKKLYGTSASSSGGSSGVGSAVSSRPLELLTIKFIATPKNTLEATMKYPGLKIIF